MTIKEGLRSINAFLMKVKVKHLEDTEKDAQFYQDLIGSEEARQERRKRRERIQVNMVRRVVLETQQKRIRSPSSP